jgi:hypothetical protein
MSILSASVSEDSIKKEDLISHLGHEEPIEADDDHGLENHIEFLENNYAVMEKINTNKSDFENLREEDILKNQFLLREIINQKYIIILI